MKAVLFWIIPPLAGAIIGYVTNAIAIKMLFRPLKEVRFFGLRLPFTPGILPRERGKLADSIGRMVGQQLLTPGVLRERLTRTEVRENMEGAMAVYTGQLLERPLSYWLEEREDTLPLSDFLYTFVNSEVFNSFLEELLNNYFKSFHSLLTPPARKLIKAGLVHEMRKEEASVYKLAMKSVAEKYPGITLGEFLSLGNNKKKEIDFFLAEKAVKKLNENVEGALSSINVQTLVSDRINSLEMIKVEKIVLDVMAGQLKWINFFGAILGAFIGFAEVLLAFFFQTQ